MSVIFCLRFAHFVLYCGGGGSKKEITVLRALRAWSGGAPTLVPFEASFFGGRPCFFFGPKMIFYGFGLCKFVLLCVPLFDPWCLLHSN